MLGLPVRRRRQRDPPPAHRAHARRLARRRSPTCRSASRYGFRVDGPWDPEHGRGSTRPSCCSTPTPGRSAASVGARAGDAGSRRRRPEPSAATLDSAPRDAAVGRGARRLRLGGRPPAPTPVARHRHLRAARQGLHPAARPGARAPARHVRRPRQPRPSSTTSSDLGVSAVELLPVHQFFTEPAVAARGLENYWGYNSIGFFAPHAAYSSSGDRGQQVTEFKQMVKAFHRAGIEVILDVVYNHTAEGEADGPALSFRGLDDLGFYKRSGTGHDSYWDVTGCGNTVDTTDRGALRLILDSLRYWVTEMHVDGFRFDLISALARTGHEIDMRSAFLTTIGQDPVLRHVKLIAEPWDASMDGYRVGSFPPPWVEWNDQYRDAIRDFWRQGTPGIRDRRHPARRLVRPVRRRRPLAVRLGQLRHRARRLHRARPGDLRPQAQRGQRRAQPRRHRQQPLLEPRRRGRDRRRRGRRAAPPPGGQHDGHALPVQRRPDDHRRRRARPHPARQQQRLLPGQRDLVGRLAPRRRLARRLRDHQDGAAAASRAPGAAPAALVRGTADDRRRPQGPRLAAPLRPRDDRRRLARRQPARRRHVRVRRPAALPRPARRAAARRVVHDLVQRRGRAGRRDRCRRTSGCTPARSCCPPTPTSRPARPSTPATRSPSARARSWCSASG